ncbi:MULTISPECIES: winged helix-turn-helix transcriptional regulator [unclassified Streptomyces]|uniref:winged helix-turn-helix transcriptional regulator n=1 Tax=unclassified Streptomyces TaxID=2593676 RepID=UPI0006AFF849|nr:MULTISPECIES: helix-turn-helix transcriptional regulator [unclassified Streptomyces]KOX19459.1 hypothetical protein ADL06_28895 [Streptomyces sp. NRRL F-6491]KOX48302.1 hypothetical protein ADL08_11090 [Streptomyces sp. NRRL F-6492]
MADELHRITAPTLVLVGAEDVSTPPSDASGHRYTAGPMRRTSFENWPCSVARTTDLLGDWWTPLVLREAFYGTRRFEDFQSELGIARATHGEIPTPGREFGHRPSRRPNLYVGDRPGIPVPTASDRDRLRVAAQDAGEGDP